MEIWFLTHGQDDEPEGRPWRYMQEEREEEMRETLANAGTEILTPTYAIASLFLLHDVKNITVRAANGRLTTYWSTP